MSESIIFRGTHIRYFDGRQEEGGAFVRIHLTSEFTGPIMQAMDWEEPGSSVTDAKLDGELHAVNFILTPGDKQLAQHEIQFGIRSVEDFKVVTIEKDEVKRRELRFIVRSSSEGVAALVDNYVRRIGDHQGALKVSYTKQETLPLEEAKPIAGKPKKEKTACKHCDAGIPTKESDDAEHVNGEACKVWERNTLMDAANAAHEVASNPVEKSEVEPATYTPTTAEPNEHGVYHCEPTFEAEFKKGKITADVGALMLAEGEWASRLWIDSPRRSRAGSFMNTETFLTLDYAIAREAFSGEKIARAEINQHKGAMAVAWLELAGWFQQHWTSRRPLSFETVDQWASYLEGMLEPEEAEMAEAVG